MESPRCNEVKMTVGSERCELYIDGRPIKYEKPENLEDSLKMIIGKMCNDLLTFIPDFKVNTISFRFNDDHSYHMWRPIYKERFPQLLEVDTLIVKSFYFWAWLIGEDIINYDKLRVYEYHYLMEKDEDDIMKVEVGRNEYTRTDGKTTSTRNCYIKYFREGQEDIYVDKPELLPSVETVDDSLY
uniref:FBA_2 domain-containing protein n=1 Tax=Caenorhabditis tropicalis TaxID=1561998 RepID=A0A1I7UEV0_9PELO